MFIPTYKAVEVCIDEPVDHVTECLLITPAKRIVRDIVNQTLEEIGWDEVFWNHIVINEIGPRVFVNSDTWLVPKVGVRLRVLFHPVLVVLLGKVDDEPIPSGIKHNTVNV